MATRQQAFSVYAMAYAWRGPFTYTDDTLNFASLLGQIDAARHESLAEIGDLEKRLREAGMLSDATADTRALDAAEEDAALTRAGAGEVRRERDIAQAQVRALQELEEATRRELQQAKEALEQARAKVDELNRRTWFRCGAEDLTGAEVEALRGAGFTWTTPGGWLCPEDGVQVLRWIAAGATVTASETMTLGEVWGRLTASPALAVCLGATLREAREHGAAEMRGLAARFIREMGSDTEAESEFLSEVAHRVEHLPLCPETQAQQDPASAERGAAVHRRDATMVALCRLGVSTGCAIAAARIAEEEGGAAPETAHSAVLKIAKMNKVAFMGAEMGPEAVRVAIHGMLPQAAGLSTEDAETLRGKGYLFEDGLWMPPSKAIAWSPTCEKGLKFLRGLAAEIRAEKAPAAAHGEPERHTGEVTTATGSSSVAPTGGAAQGADEATWPTPGRVQTWSPREDRAAALCRCGVEAPARGDVVGVCKTCGGWRAIGAASAPHGLPKPARVEVGQRWRSVNVQPELMVREVNGAREVWSRAPAHPYREVLARESFMLTSDTWSFLAPAPQGPTGGGEAEKSELTVPAEPTDLDKIEALSAHLKSAIARGEERQRAREEQGDSELDAPAEATPLEPTAADAVVGMLLRRGYPLTAAELAHGRLNIEHTVRVLARDPVTNDDRACIAALEALARGELSRPRHTSNLVAAIDRLTKSRDEARAEAAALRKAASTPASVHLRAALELQDDVSLDRVLEVAWHEIEELRALCGRPTADGEQLLHDEKRGVRLVIAKDADAREVLATVAELLGLSGARVVGEPDPRSVEQIEAEAMSINETRPALAQRMMSYALGIREGERRSAAQIPDFMRRLDDDARVERERQQATARGLVDVWTTRQERHREQSDADEKRGYQQGAERYYGRAAATERCANDLRTAFGITPPDGGPGGGETSERSEAEQHAESPVSSPTSDVGGLSRDVALRLANDWADAADDLSKKSGKASDVLLAEGEARAFRAAAADVKAALGVEPCATCGGSGLVSAGDYTGNMEDCADCDGPPASADTEPPSDPIEPYRAKASPEQREDDEDGLVDLAFCIGSRCTKQHGLRIATWRGTGPSSIYIVCDECHDDRLTANERAHMVEVRGVERVRHLGLHMLHNGRFHDDQPDATAAPDREALGREVHEAWREYARKEGLERPCSWEDLGSFNKGADCAAGERLFSMGVKHGRALSERSDARLSEIARLEDAGDLAGARALLERVAADLGEDDSRVVAARWELRLAEGRGTPAPTPQDGSSAIRSADTGLPAGEWKLKVQPHDGRVHVWDVFAMSPQGEVNARFAGLWAEERARAYARWISAPAAAVPVETLRVLAAEWLQDAREIDDSARDERAKLKAGKTSRFMLGFLTGSATSNRERAKDLCRVAGIEPPPSMPQGPSSPPKGTSQAPAQDRSSEPQAPTGPRIIFTVSVNGGMSSDEAAAAIRAAAEKAFASAMKPLVAEPPPKLERVEVGVCHNPDCPRAGQAVSMRMGPFCGGCGAHRSPAGYFAPSTAFPVRPIASSSPPAPEAPRWRGLEHEARRGRWAPGAWIVQRDRYAATFDGPAAEARAKEYAAFVSAPAAERCRVCNSPGHATADHGEPRGYPLSSNIPVLGKPGAAIASELARRWLQPRLNMINRLRHPAGLTAEQLVKARAVGRIWRAATRQVCEAFALPMPQPDPSEPSVEHARALLDAEDELLRAPWEDTMTARDPIPPSSPIRVEVGQRWRRKATGEVWRVWAVGAEGVVASLALDDGTDAERSVRVNELLAGDAWELVTAQPKEGVK